MDKQKRIITVQDISCLGRCSITAALPVLSAFGIETAILPTAILSTHTGGFTGFTFKDLEDEVMPIVKHWMSLDDVYFDGIYTGYLANKKQIELISSIFDLLETRFKLYKMVDPAMADNGVMYQGFNDEFAFEMKRLCEKADIIVPNLTEACKMLDIEYKDGVLDKKYVENIIYELYKLGPKQIVLTSVILEKGKVGTACYDGSEIKYYFKDKIEGYFHGSGDIYSSVLYACLLKGDNLLDAVKIATDFTYESILKTKENNTPFRYGVSFEEVLAERNK